MFKEIFFIVNDQQIEIFLNPFKVGELLGLKQKRLNV